MSIAEEKNVLCPFYKKSKAYTPHQELRHITCEGITDDCSVSVNFNSNIAREQHLKIYCCGNYTYCEIYRAVYGAKYEE